VIIDNLQCTTTLNEVVLVPTTFFTIHSYSPEADGLIFGKLNTFDVEIGNPLNFHTISVVFTSGSD